MPSPALVSKYSTWYSDFMWIFYQLVISWILLSYITFRQNRMQLKHVSWTSNPGDFSCYHLIKLFLLHKPFVFFKLTVKHELHFCHKSPLWLWFMVLSLDFASQLLLSSCSFDLNMYYTVYCKRTRDFSCTSLWFMTLFWFIFYNECLYGGGDFTTLLFVHVCTVVQKCSSSLITSWLKCEE